MKNLCFGKEGTLSYDREGAAVLLHCLAYGENAISAADEAEGVGNIIRQHVAKFRKAISKDLMEAILFEAGQNPDLADVE